MLSCIPALLCDECASHLSSVPWALQGRVAVPKEGMCDCLVADRAASLYVAFGSLIFQMLPFLSLRSTSLVYQGSQGYCRVMRKLDQEQEVMFSLLILI